MASNALVNEGPPVYAFAVRWFGDLTNVTKISDEARAVAAASLVQAHAAILGGVYAGRKPGATVSVIPQELIEKLFAHYLGVVDHDPAALRNGLARIEEL